MLKKINLLDKFLNIKNINDISVLLNQNELGKKGIEELDFILKSIGSLELKSSELKFNISLARGLDYYTGSIFEVKSSDVNIGSVAGGGRYDDLTSIFGLKDVSGVGISFGIDRIYLVMEELGLFPKDIDISSKVLFLNFGELEAKYCFKYLKELRNNNISSELYPNNDKIKKQMNYANNKGVQFVVMIGEDEMKSGQLTVKNMSTGEQNEMSISELIKIIL
jgi:histidyl-tRNA synthetase